MEETAPQRCGLICEPGTCPSAGATTYYVHLHDGDVVPVTDVCEIEVTRDTIVFQRREKAAVIYPRQAVYFTCCQKDQPPPQF